MSQPALIVRSFGVVVDKLGQTLAFWLVMKWNRWTSIQVDKYSSGQVFKYSSIQVFKYSLIVNEARNSHHFP